MRDGGLPRDAARLREEFVSEASEILEKAAETFEVLEEQGEDAPADSLNAFFRSIHTLKGLAGMVGLTRLGEAAHAFEALLDGARMGRVPMDRKTLLAARKALAAFGDTVKRLPVDADPGVDEKVLAGVRAALAPREAVAAAPKGKLLLPPAIEASLTDYERHRLEENARKGKKVFIVPLDLPFETFDEQLRQAMTEAGRLGELVGTFPGTSASLDSMAFQLVVGTPGSVTADEVAKACGAPSVLEVPFEGGAPLPVDDAPAVTGAASTPLTESLRDSKAAASTPLTESLRDPNAAPPAADELPAAPAEPEREGPAEDASRAIGAGTVRVPLPKISHLLDLAGELALSRGTLAKSVEAILRNAPGATPEDRARRHDAQRALTQLDRLVSSLGHAILATRLVPVEQLATRLSRTVKSLSASLEKEVEFVVLGGETEIDKVLADALSDPFLHLVRNALDHGLERPEARERAGKRRRGRLTLSAEARGRDVVFSLTDDGGGMDPQKLVSRARERGLLVEDEAPPDDPLDLIFRPGFSTAVEVSEVSGRGVGLDVVLSNILAVKGRVSVASTKGQGTTFTVVVPMTLALVESLLVKSGGKFFAFPTSSITRTLSVEPSRIHLSGGRMVLSVDGVDLPVVRLDQLLSLSAGAVGDVAAPGGSSRARTQDVVVAEQGDWRAGFLVSSIEGMSDIVVKLLPHDLARLDEITGAAELPDGQLALTLDAGLLLSRVRDREALVS